MAPTPPPPRVLLIMPAQWPRALLRAALREEGYDASGTRAVNGALYQAAPDPARGPVRLVLVDQDAVDENQVGLIEQLRDRISGAPMLLMAPATRRVQEGPWARILRRPISIAALVQVIQSLVPLPAGARHPID
jgi:DNA-binding response OmpR family regulator